MLGWLRAAASSLTSRFETVRNRTISLIADWLTNSPWLISSAFYTLATKAYGGNAVVYACVRLLAQSIPEAPLRAYQEGGDGKRVMLDRNHPLCQLIAHPNELMTEYEFWELTTIHMTIAGQSFWWKERANSGQILALWPLRPDRIAPLYSDSDKLGERVILGWNYQDPGTGEFVPIPRRDVLAFNLPSPASERNRADSGGIVEGLGPIQVLAAEISADNEATSFVGALLKNYAAPTVALKVKAAVRNEETAEMLKARFKAQFGGGKRGEPALLDADTEIEMIGFNLEQLEFPDLRAVAESRVAAGIGVPAVLVGLKAGLDRMTYSNLAEARAYFAETTLSNYWRRYSDQFTNDLAIEYGEGIVCEFDTSSVRALAGQRIEKIQPIKEGFTAGAVTRGEYRAAMGLEVRDGDDVYVISSSMIEIPAGATTPVAAKALLRGPVALKVGIDPQDAAENSLAGILETALNEVGNTVAAQIRAGEVVTDAELEAAFIKALQPALTAIAMSEMLRLGGEMAIPFDPAAVRQMAAEWAKTYTYEMVKGITSTTQGVIADAVSGYMADTSMSMGQLREMLEPAFGKVRAQMISTTETTRAFAAANDLYRAQLEKEYGVKTDRVWYTRDEGACPICLPLDGQHERRADGSGWANDHPGGPPLHVNCRCRTVISVVKVSKQ